jgi:hypothetical protein
VVAVCLKHRNNIMAGNQGGGADEGSKAALLGRDASADEDNFGAGLLSRQLVANEPSTFIWQVCVEHNDLGAQARCEPPGFGTGFDRKDFPPQPPKLSARHRSEAGVGMGQHQALGMTILGNELHIRRLLFHLDRCMAVWQPSVQTMFPTK